MKKNDVQIKWKSLVLSFLMLMSVVLGTVPSFASAQVATPGKLRVGMEANYAPFNWAQTSDENGAVAIANSEGEYANGYDVQIAKKIADSLGLELEIVKYEWDGLPPAVMTGKIDAIIAGMSPTAERKEQIDFSDSYYTSDLVVVVQKGSQWAEKKTLADFSGARITGQLNTFHYSVIDQIPGVSKETALDSFPTMIEALKSDRIDGYVSEKPGAMAAVAANPDLVFVEFEQGQGFNTSSEDTSIAVGIQKGSSLTGEVNNALSLIGEEERAQVMEEMVMLNVAEEGGTQSFFGSIVSMAREYGSLFIRGAAITMLIAIVSTLIGFLIGLVIGVVRSIPLNRKKRPGQYHVQKVINFLLAAYVEIIRGTPMMVQAVLFYYGSKQLFNLDINILLTAFIVVSVNTGAYLAEVVRGGINSIDKGQFEACKAIGMSHTQTMTNVVLPQAIRNILPMIGNEFVINIKDTSVLNVIAVTELFFVTRSIVGSTYQAFQGYLITAAIYFVLTFTTTRIIRLLERRLDRDRRIILTSDSVGGV